MPKNNKYRVGALCAGYGGIELGLDKLLKTETMWVSDFEEIPTKILEKRFIGPDGDPIQNYGDLTTLTDPNRVDIVTAGFPCQPVSISGRRKGIEDERWLIEDVCRVARESGAKWLILENVRGIFTANHGEALRKVWDALVHNGYTRFEWGLFRASDSYAPHQRERWFCLATSTHAEILKIDTDRNLNGYSPNGELEVFGQSQRWKEANNGLAGLNVELNWVERKVNEQFKIFDQSNSGLLTKWKTDGCSDGTGFLYDQTKFRKTLEKEEGFKPLPTPTAREYKDAGPNVNFPRIAKRRGLTGVVMHELCRNQQFIGWDEYGIAIREWASVIGRPAPNPLESGKFGYLSPQFVEWMMGLPEGWVTGRDIGLRRTEALRALGNGVVPHQAADAVQILHQRMKRKLHQLSPEEQKMRKILDLRQEGFTWKQVANCLGYSSSSGPRSFLNRRTSKYVERFDGNFALSGD